jgi:hypothetical protein
VPNVDGVQRSLSTDEWNAGAFSTAGFLNPRTALAGTDAEQVSGISFRFADASCCNAMVGLSTTNADASFASINFAM